ncbi:MAG: 1-phosphofructokinase [Armatimonadota bacterium]
MSTVNIDIAGAEHLILTVTLNSTIDKTYIVDNFRVDRIHQAQSLTIIPGGKGINVGRVFNELGGRAFLTGFAGGHNGDFISENTQAESLASDFIRVSGESRTCVKIVDPINKTQTEISELGPFITQDEIERFHLKFESLVLGMDYVVLSGSIPPGVSDDIYRELIEIAHRYDVKCMLDASGTPLAEGIKARPSIIKPNVHELSELVGKQLDTVEEAVKAAKKILAEGIDVVIVTFGRDGAIVVTSDEVWRATPPTITYVSAVGSGDSFGAGFIYALIEGKSMADALRLGTAAGAANAGTPSSGMCRKEDILLCVDQTVLSAL